MCSNSFNLIDNSMKAACDGHITQLHHFGTFEHSLSMWHHPTNQMCTITPSTPPNQLLCTDQCSFSLHSFDDSLKDTPVHSFGTVTKLCEEFTTAVFKGLNKDVHTVTATVNSIL